MMTPEERDEKRKKIEAQWRKKIEAQCAERINYEGFCAGYSERLKNHNSWEYKLRLKQRRQARMTRDDIIASHGFREDIFCAFATGKTSKERGKKGCDDYNRGEE